jgi:hypothetical protein
MPFDDFGSHIVELFDDLHRILVFVWLASHQSSRPVQGMGADISFLVFDPLACELGQWVVHWVFGDYVDHPEVLFVCVERPLALLRVVKKIADLDCGALLRGAGCGLCCKLSILELGGVPYVAWVSFRCYGQERAIADRRQSFAPEPKGADISQIRKFLNFWGCEPFA